MTEQELNKACEWLEKYMESLGYIDEWCRNGEDTFRKAMGVKTNPLFEQALANVNPETRADVRKNMELTMTEKLHDILECIYYQGCYAGESSHFDDWLYEEGCDRADYITKIIREALETKED